MKHSIGELRDLTIAANRRRELEEQRKRQEEEDRKRKQEATEELEFEKEASAILDLVLDKAHEAAQKGSNIVDAYEIPNNQIDFNIFDISISVASQSIYSGWYGRDLSEHEYVLSGPLKVVFRNLKTHGFKVVVRHQGGAGGSSIRYLLAISW